MMTKYNLNSGPILLLTVMLANDLLNHEYSEQLVLKKLTTKKSYD